MPNPSPALSTGAWCMLGEPLTTVQIAQAGFDWVCIDQQHGAFGDAAMLTAMRALALLPERPQVAIRVGELTDFSIGRALDAGADIVIVPMIETVEQAREAAKAAHYPPIGCRSWGPMGPLWGAQAPTVSDSRPELWAMVETRAGFESVRDILKVEGVDGIFVGPFDLSLSLGTDVSGLLEATGSEDPFPSLLTAARQAGSRIGVFAGDPATASKLVSLGFDTIAVATDSCIIAQGASAVQQIALGAEPIN